MHLSSLVGEPGTATSLGMHYFQKIWSSLMTENSRKEFLMSPWENGWLSQYLSCAQS